MVISCRAILSLLICLTFISCERPDKIANIGKTKTQFNQYGLALQQFKSVYGRYPDFLEGYKVINLGEAGMSDRFYEAMSGRKLSGEIARTEGNRKGIAFLSFSEREYEVDESGRMQLHDAFGNPNIIIARDLDGDGIITLKVKGRTYRIERDFYIFSLPTEDFPEVLPSL